MFALEPVEIRLLGPLVVRRRDGTAVSVSEWRTGKAVDLLRLLALQPGVAMDADLLADELWPDAVQERARASLRTAAYHLRRVLGDEHLARQGAALRLQDVWIDAASYAELADQVDGARRAELHPEAVRLCREAEGLYLGDVDGRGLSPRVADAAERLRALRRRTLLHGAESALAVGWMHDAIALAESARDLDVHSERATRVLMTASAGIGEVRAAHAVYERLRHDLRRDLGTDPSPQTRAVHYQVQAGLAEPSVPPDPGRSRVEEIARALGELVAGSDGAGLVLLVGDPGSGRRRLAAAAAAALGFTLRNADPAHLQQDDSDVTARSPGRRVVLAMPAIDRLTSTELTWHARLARERRAIMVLPANRVDAGVLETAPEGVSLVRVPTATSAELEQLAASVLQGCPSPALVERLARESAGLIGRAHTQLTSWLASESVVWTTEGLDVRAQASGALPLSALLRSRLGAESSVAVDALCAVALADTALTADEVTRILHATQPYGESHATVDTAGILSRLLDAGLLELNALGYRLSREEHRDDLLRWLRPSRRVRLHAAVAAEVDVTDLDRVRHLISAGRHEAAADLGARALARARVVGDDAAVRHWEMALSRLPRRLQPDGVPGPIVARVHALTDRLSRGFPALSASPMLSHRVHGDLEMALLRALGVA